MVMRQSENRLDKAANAGRHPLSDHPGDCYDTPACAVHALLAVENLPQRIWEPACGLGNIVGVLRSAGHRVIATDITDRGCPDSHTLDFLTAPPRQGIDAIVTNPPYSLAAEFIATGLQHAPIVIALLRLAFLESTRRAYLLDSGKLARVHVFSNRLPMMHRDGWTGPTASSAIAFAWFVFDGQHRGPAALSRIRWEAS